MRAFARLFVIVMAVLSAWGGSLSAFAQAVSIRTTTGPYTFYESSRALVIGVSKYENWTELAAVPQEVKLVEDFFKVSGFETTTLMNPNRADLVDTIRRFLVRESSEQSRLVVYFAGHGHTVDNLGYVVPSDAQRVDAADVVFDLVSMDEIKAWSHQSRAKHVLFVFNSCFSGSAFAARNNLAPALQTVVEADQPSRQYITAGGAKDPVPDTVDFAHAFVDGLEGQADVVKDGVVSALELGVWIADRMPKNNNPVPLFGWDTNPKFSGGNVLFVNPQSIDSMPMSSLQELPLSVEPESIYRGVDVVYRQSIADGDAVLTALDRGSIPYQIAPPTTSDDAPTNTLICGATVPPVVLRELARTLIIGGVRLQQIVPLPESIAGKKIELVSAVPSTGRLLPGVITLADIVELEGCVEFVGRSDAVASTETGGDVAIATFAGAPLAGDWHGWETSSTGECPTGSFVASMEGFKRGTLKGNDTRAALVELRVGCRDANGSTELRATSSSVPQTEIWSGFSTTRGPDCPDGMFMVGIQGFKPDGSAAHEVTDPISELRYSCRNQSGTISVVEATAGPVDGSWAGFSGTNWPLCPVGTFVVKVDAFKPIEGSDVHDGISELRLTCRSADEQGATASLPLEEIIDRTICMGQFRENCDPTYAYDAFFACDAGGSDIDMAAATCGPIGARPVSAVRLSTHSGNKCGYAAVAIQCAAPL